jgi:hypothetical protein
MDSGGLPDPDSIGPTPLDHLPGMGGDYTDWITKNYPGWKAEARKRFINQIMNWVHAHCGESPFPGPSNRISVYPGRQRTGLTKSTAENDKGGNETKYGDKPQSEFSADKSLGSFTIDFVTPVNISYMDLPGGYKFYSFTTTMYFEDVLGLQDDDWAYNSLTKHLFPERKSRLAKYPLTGFGVCCSKK